MTVFADSLTGGIIGGTIAAVLLALVCIAGIVMSKWFFHFDSYSVFGRRWCVIGWSVLLVLVVIGWTAASWPLAYDYHHWIDKNVTVAAQSSRLLTDSDGNINQKIVVKDTSGSFYGVNDTRGALVKERDRIHLRCKRAWEFGTPRSANGWDCKWAGRTA